MLAGAQTVPDAGAVRQQIERDQHPALPPKSAPLAMPPPPMKSIGTATVTVATFKFSGNTLLTAGQLSRAVAAFVGRPLTFADLQNAAIAVAMAYRRAGWVVRAYLPQQDVTGGTVTIEVIEARLGAVRIDGATQRSSNRRLTRIIESAQKPGTTLNARALDRALLLVGDLPGVVATGSLTEGAKPGETDLVLDVKDGPKVTGAAIVDNEGARYTGSVRASVSASLNAPFGIGDRADTVLLHSRGSDYQRLAYSLPAGSAGWSVGVNGSHLTYAIVTTSFGALDAHGNSSTVGLAANYPVLRTRLANLYLALNVDDKRFDNITYGRTATRYSIQDAIASVYGNLFDNLGGGGANAASITFEQGNDDLAASPNKAADAMTTRTSGGFEKLNLSVSRQQRLTERVSLFASLAGQLASKNLDSSEKFYLGGSNGVRAYPADEGGGSEGALANVEARVRLPRNLSGVGFFDYGTVRINRNNAYLGAARPNTDRLKGIGISLAWTAAFGLNVKATVARRIGRNPVPTSTGADQDGSLITNRVWLQISMPF
ncbi:MAG: ShlB/FhaC/HecB family hemolysin secretion/activation protein [Gammaproteobacteria bacterium]|nr:ShlB/FhaC/HecB family hemolysin secretion/activation protein [Gammaproteobacteria bacterium]